MEACGVEVLLESLAEGSLVSPLAGPLSSDAGWGVLPCATVVSESGDSGLSCCLSGWLAFLAGGDSCSGLPEVAVPKNCSKSPNERRGSSPFCIASEIGFASGLLTTR